MPAVEILTAVCAIVEADNAQATPGTMGNLLARASDYIGSWQTIDQAPDETVSYWLVDEPVAGNDLDTREPILQLSCFAKTIAKARAMAKRLEAIITAPALLAAGVDAAPLYPEQQMVPAARGIERKLERVDLTLRFSAVNE